MKITPESLENGSTQKRSVRAEAREVFLRRITHVSLVGREITVMENLHFCKNLSVLYLYDNNITQIAGLECCRNLSQLYLQNNQIEEITGLEVGLDQLSILHLHNNRIGCVTGLDRLPALEVLKVDRQRLEDGEALSFEEGCLMAIRGSLKSLTAAGNRITDLDAIVLLQNLESLDISENELADAKTLSENLLSFPNLMTLNVALNPLALTHPAKLRQRLILASRSLDCLNEKPIPPVERKFAENLRKVQESRRRASMTPGSTAQVSRQVSSVGLEAGAGTVAAEKPTPHLPPYASQYRDMILSMQSQVPESARPLRSRESLSGGGNLASAAENGHSRGA
ncbi:hypothetical protein HKX48_003269 [Thoreauomyces humboldtii]|nr:hypothetical protein HKX48_003269 [Thoreauomyces humboldtii]